MMTKLSETRTIKELKRRYFRSQHGLCHHGDCRIYSCPDHDNCFCSCGLLHDLTSLDPSLATILYPKYDQDHYKQERQEDYQKPTLEKEAEMEEAKRILYEVFGKPADLTLEDIRSECYDNLKLIKLVFGDEFPLAEQRARALVSDRIREMTG